MNFRWLQNYKVKNYILLSFQKSCPELVTNGREDRRTANPWLLRLIGPFIEAFNAPTHVLSPRSHKILEPRRNLSRSVRSMALSCRRVPSSDTVLVTDGVFAPVASSIPSTFPSHAVYRTVSEILSVTTRSPALVVLLSFP
jgi:hypothetical protein